MSVEYLKMYVKEQIADAAIDAGDPEVDEHTKGLKNGLEMIERLEDDSEFLNNLEACGVDNWVGYSDAWQMMGEDE